MGVLLSATLADIHMVRTGNDDVTPSKPVFYKRYIDDIFNCCKRNVTDILFEKLYNNLGNINFIIETNLKKFLDTEIIDNNGAMEMKVYRKPIELPMNWASNIPKRYKGYTINAALY